MSSDLQVNRKCQKHSPGCLPSPAAALPASPSAHRLKCVCCSDYYSPMPWLYSFAFSQAVLNLDSSLFLISQVSCLLPCYLQPPILQLVILINTSLQLAIKPFPYNTLNRIRSSPSPFLKRESAFYLSNQLLATLRLLVCIPPLQ